MKLQQNAGPLDRITRTILGVLLVAVKYFFHYGGWTGTILLGAGLILIAEGVLGYCLLYDLLGWSTKRRRAR